MNSHLYYLCIFILIIISPDSNGEWILKPNSADIIPSSLPSASNEQSPKNDLITNKPEYFSHEIIDFTYKYTNKTNNEDVFFRLNLIEENEFIEKDTNITSNNEAYDLTTSQREIKWQGKLATPQLNAFPFNSDFFGYIPLKETFNIKPQACKVNCEKNIWWLDFNFEFQGRNVNRFYISKNGQVSFETPDINSNATPSSAYISPFFSPQTENITNFNTEVRFAELIHQESSDIFLVIEWTEKDSITNNLINRYQLIIEEFTNNLWFNYLNIPTIPNDTFAGAQNTTGLVKFNLIKTSARSLIESLDTEKNQSFMLKNNPGEHINLSSSLSLANVSTDIIDYEYSTLEDTQLDIEINMSDLLGTATIVQNSSNGKQQSYDISVNLEPPKNRTFSMEVTNGSSELSSNLISYLPNRDFNGEDELVLYINDNFVSSTENTIIEVEPVNDTPNVTIVSSSPIVKSSTLVTLTAQIDDIDSTTHTLKWMQISGPEVNFELNDKSISFITPNPKPFISVPIRFEVLVFDEEFRVRSEIQLLVENKSGGSTFYLLFFIIFAHVKQLFNNKLIH